MAGYSTAGRDRMLNALVSAGGALFASLHSSHPGDAGANEIAGGAPPYARQAITWNASASASVTSATNPTFNVPAATTIQFMGLWSLVVAGTFYGSMPLGGNAGFPFYAGAATDLFEADNHGLTNLQQVIVMDTNIGVLPTPLIEGTIYFVRDVAGDAFKLAATSGGAAIDLTADGTGFISPIVPEVFGGQGSYATSQTTLSLLR